ncbi:MAG: hypothetical protein WCE73_21115 [Candidatus Angelobacter sp.]|jgi:hypothetical protein
MAGKINFNHLPGAIQEAVKAAHNRLPNEELIMGFIAPEGIGEKQAETIAKEITQKVAPGAQPFVGPAAAGSGGVQTGALTKPGRILGFRPTPQMLG